MSTPRRHTCLAARVRALAAALLVAAWALAAARPAAGADWTDIWWAVPEVGWGVNFVQSDRFIFATFYQQCPVLKAATDEERASRLSLCDLTARVLSRGLGLVGIDVPERM